MVCILRVDNEWFSCTLWFSSRALFFALCLLVSGLDSKAGKKLAETLKQGNLPVTFKLYKNMQHSTCPQVRKDVVFLFFFPTPANRWLVGELVDSLVCSGHHLLPSLYNALCSVSPLFLPSFPYFTSGDPRRGGFHRCLLARDAQQGGRGC